MGNLAASALTNLQAQWKMILASDGIPNIRAVTGDPFDTQRF
jgi:serine phosphatase RsbU (regulator of sigma subunit)